MREHHHPRHAPERPSSSRDICGPARSRRRLRYSDARAIAEQRRPSNIPGDPRVAFTQFDEYRAAHTVAGVVLYERVSYRHQDRNGNLDDAWAENIAYLHQRRFRFDRRNLIVIEGVESSSIYDARTLLEAAIDGVLQRPGWVLFVCARDRALRHAMNDGTKEGELPTAEEYARFIERLRGVPATTRLHPEEPGRSAQVKRGQHEAKQAKFAAIISGKLPQRELMRMVITKARATPLAG